MTQYYTLNAELSNSQFNKLKSAIRNRTDTTLNLSSNLIRNSNDKTNFPHELLLTDTEVSKIHKVFENGSSANINFSKTQLPKIVQSGGVLRNIHVFGNMLSSKAIKETDIVRNLEKKRQKDRFNIKHITGSGITLKK